MRSGKDSWMQLVVALAAASALVGCTDGSDDTGAATQRARRYGVKSGVIEYEMTGLQTGTETRYWDDYGLLEAKVTMTEMSMLGVSHKTNQLKLIDRDWIYSIDLDTKTGTKARNTMLETLAENASDEGLAQLGIETLHGMAGEKLGTMDIAGKTCDLYAIQGAGTRTCVWQAVPLLTQIQGMGVSQNAVATKIDEGVKVAADRFAVPEGIRLRDAPDLSALRRAAGEAKQP